MNVPAKTVEQQIISLHNGIVIAMRRTVADAIEIGKLLSEKKAELDHGDFLPWIERELPFSEATAQRYMQVFRWKDKTRSVRDLSEAYHIARTAEFERRIEPPKAEPVRQKGPTITDEEYERRKAEEFKDEREAPSLDEAFEDVQKILIRQEKETVFREFDLAALVDELRRRILVIAEPSRRHHAINQIIKAMRELAIECDRISIR